MWYSIPLQAPSCSLPVQGLGGAPIPQVSRTSPFRDLSFGAKGLVGNPRKHLILGVHFPYKNKKPLSDIYMLGFESYSKSKKVGI